MEDTHLQLQKIKGTEKMEDERTQFMRNSKGRMGSNSKAGRRAKRRVY